MVEESYFKYVNEKEYRAIESFHKRHKHIGVYKGFIRRDPYHIEIIPHSIGCWVKVVCDVCKGEYNKGSRDIEWKKDVTDWSDW